ncbi:response regulator [Pseudoduganella flava]|nr:response regulator [Pseudoduganella flava]
MNARNVLIIDDHPMFRTGLGLILRTALEGIAVQEVGALHEALAPAIAEPAVILLDVHLRGLNGLECVAALLGRWPAAAIVVLSADATEATARAALARGAVAFVPKSDTAADIIDTVRQLLHGEFARQPVDAAAHAPGLTPRQQQVLDLLCQGLPNKTIGRRLDLSENTVRGHVQAVLAFLGAPSRTKAAFEARRRGLVD